MDEFREEKARLEALILHQIRCFAEKFECDVTAIGLRTEDVCSYHVSRVKVCPTDINLEVRL